MGLGAGGCVVLRCRRFAVAASARLRPGLPFGGGVCLGVWKGGSVVMLEWLKWAAIVVTVTSVAWALVAIAEYVIAAIRGRL